MTTEEWNAERKRLEDEAMLAILALYAHVPGIKSVELKVATYGSEITFFVELK